MTFTRVVLVLQYAYRELGMCFWLACDLGAGGLPVSCGAV
jgi:hypothetical protein